MSFVLDVARHLVLWPRDHQIKDDVGCWGMMGRLSHWSGAAFASNVIVVGVAAAAFDPNVEPLPTINFSIVAAAMIYLPARGLRLLMAGE